MIYINKIGDLHGEFKERTHNCQGFRLPELKREVRAKSGCSFGDNLVCVDFEDRFGVTPNLE